MMVEELAQRLRAHGLARVTDTLLTRALYAIAIRCRRVDEHELDVGTSKIGGLPDLPPHVTWPKQHGRPMGFIAQINLREVAPYDVDGVLPPTGLLSFFYLDPSFDPSGTIDDPEASKVIARVQSGSLHAGDTWSIQIEYHPSRMAYNTVLVRVGHDKRTTFMAPFGGGIVPYISLK